MLHAQNSNGLKVAPADTLLILEEEALLRSLQELASEVAASNTGQVQVGQEDLMQVLRYQLMLNLLAPKEPNVVYHIGTPGYNHQPVRKGDVAQEARLARLERMLEAMLAERNNAANATSNKIVVNTAKPKAQAVDTLALKQQRALEELEAKLAQAEARLKSLENTPHTDLNLPSLSLTEGLNGLTTNTQTVIHATDTVQVTKRVEVATDFKRSVYFNVGSSVVDSLAARTLDEVVTFLSDYPESQLNLSGFASPEGNAAYNKQLAERRLAAVVTYLTSKGVDQKRLISKATGIDRSRSGFQLARRVDLSLRDK